MIQLLLHTNNPSWRASVWSYLNIYNEIDIRFASATYPDGDFYNPLQELKSQQTGKSLFFSGIPHKTHLSRYVKMYISASISGLNTPLSGIINLGSTDFPFGFYDYRIYDNTSSSNLDPTGLKVIYNGLANVISVNEDKDPSPSPKYTEYTTNDADTDNVYLTN